MQRLCIAMVLDRQREAPRFHLACLIKGSDAATVYCYGTRQTAGSPALSLGGG